MGMTPFYDDFQVHLNCGSQVANISDILICGAREYEMDKGWPSCICVFIRQPQTF